MLLQRDEPNVSQNLNHFTKTLGCNKALQVFIPILANKKDLQPNLYTGLTVVYLMLIMRQQVRHDRIWSCIS
jgi:hypothetical protein